MDPVAIEAWSDLFVAAAGASAALAGLVFVAVSINIEHVISYKGLPEMAIVTLMLLLGVLIVSLFSLVPGQTPHSLGIMLGIQSVLWTFLIARFAIRSLPDREHGQRVSSRLILPAIGTAPYVVGAIILLTGSESGMYWIFAGMVGAIIAAVLDAWVLLVEIRR